MIAAIAGFIGAIPTLGKHARQLRTWWRRRQDIKRAAGKVTRLHSPTSLFSTFLFRDEVLVIVTGAVLLNYVCSVFARNLTSILFLDMTGTALAALLLGPWYGAMVGLLSNGIVNWILYPGPNGDAVIAPWAIVNICGGLLWGYFGRSKAFSQFMAKPTGTIADQVYYLLKFGVFGAVLMAFPGAAVQMVQQALGHQDPAFLDKGYSSALDSFLSGCVVSLRALIMPFFSEQTAVSLATYLIGCLQNIAKYVPDKTLSFAIALVIVKAAFPLFERELVHSRANTLPSRPKWLDGMFFLMLLIPFTLALVILHAQYWPLWITPMAVGLVLLCADMFRRPSAVDMARRKEDRRASYQRARDMLPRDAAIRPGQALLMACLITSLLFLLVLPFISPNYHFNIDYFHVAFNFLCLVYGFPLVMHLYSVAVSQNVAILSAKEPVPEKDLAKTA